MVGLDQGCCQAIRACGLQGGGWRCRTERQGLAQLLWPWAQSLHLPEERVRCGTIHTFQGREADIVFLVLGSSPGSSGWGSRQWASRTPNILNVALTRARSVIYVIGNQRDWRKHPFFDILAEELPLEIQGDAQDSPDGSGRPSRGSLLQELFRGESGNTAT